MQTNTQNTSTKVLRSAICYFLKGFLNFYEVLEILSTTAIKNINQRNFLALCRHKTESTFLAHDYQKYAIKQQQQ